jgi:hypothetical protein
MHLPPRTEPRAPDILDLIMRQHGCALDEAIEQLAHLAGLRRSSCR